MKSLPAALLLLLLAAQIAPAQWPTSPEQRLVVASAYTEKLVSDGAGGAFILLSSGAMAGLQKLDLYGYPVFPEPITLEYNFGDYIGQIHLVTDGFGGAIAAVRYMDSVSDSAQVRLFRFDHEGNIDYWGVSPCEPENWWAGYEYIIAPDSAGGVYILFPVTVADQRIQHLGPNGERLWGEEGIFLDVGSPSEWDFPALGTDAEYCFAGVKGTQRRAFKFTFAGNPLWGLTGVALPPFGYYAMKISPDGTGGMVGIDKGYVSGQHHLIAYRLNSEGQWVWPEGGVDLGRMYFESNILCKFPYTYICWDSSESYERIAKLCKLDTTGAAVWPENISVFASDSGQHEVIMVDADNDGLLFFGFQNFNNPPNLIYTQKYSYDGIRTWNQDVCVATGQNPNVYDLCLSGDNNGGGLYAWHEIDPLWGHRVCAAMVNRDGQMGVVLSVDDRESRTVPVTFDLLPCFPNPFNATTTLRFTLPHPSYVELDVFDIAGCSVGARHASPLLNAGTHRVLFNGSDLPSGLYLARLRAASHKVVRKLVLIK